MWWDMVLFSVGVLVGFTVCAMLTVGARADLEAEVERLRRGRHEA